MVRSALGHALDIKYKLPNTRICQNKVCIPHLVISSNHNWNPFINAFYPFTNIIAKRFFATYKNQDISYTFITDPISCDNNALVNMKKKQVDSLQLELFSMNIFDTLRSTKVPKKDNFSEDNIPTKSRPCQLNAELKCLIRPSKSPWSCTAFYVNNAAEKERGVPRMDPPWVTKGRGKGHIPRERGRSSPGSSSGSSYGSSSNSPILQQGGMSLINSKISQNTTSSSVHLEDIPEGSPLYAELHAYLSQKQIDAFASIAKDDFDDIRTYERVAKKEIIFLLENSEIQMKEEPWKIFHVEFQHFSGYNTSENVYNFYKMIIKKTISIEEWGISLMKERQISLNKIPTSFTFWDYINAFIKVHYNNNERHKHTWFIKNWVKVSPDLNDLYHSNHICYMEQIEQIYFFIEFSIAWIHKWTPEVGFIEEQIPCLYRTYYNNFWDKLMKKDPKTKSLYGQELLDSISQNIQDYGTIPHKGIVVDNFVKHIARRIFLQDGNKEEMIKEYLEEVRKKLLLNITDYEKSDTSMRSETSDDVADDVQEAQPCESEKTVSKDMLSKAEDFLRELKKKDKM
ncbi:hypothetical protein H5410_040742 [Solanum commersonii]|uniref:Uncharacterized protein n=1 Tax=Solanum commersonii TaxID=4109 RepID=A0A9J5XSD8_SOLCO|nr:hypothetical protein H5410_040742 [Solanum commersonii]